MSWTTRGGNPNHRLLIYDSLYHVEKPDAPRLVMLWKQYEFRPHFSAIRLMCNYFFKRGILLYLILVFIYYVSTEEIFVIYDGTASFCIVLDEIYFSGAASWNPDSRITFKLRWIVQPHPNGDATVVFSILFNAAYFICDHICQKADMLPSSRLARYRDLPGASRDELPPWIFSKLN